MGLAGILLALGLLIWLSYRGWSILLLAPGAAMIAAATAGEPLLAHWTQTFMGGAAQFLWQFFPLFLLGALFGKLMEDSGSVEVIARFMTEKLGTARTVLAVVLTGAIVTYGGVSLFVAIFVIVPMARGLFRTADIPLRIMPAAIALGTMTFTMSALPGTPALQNAIPMPFFGTTPFVAPGIGIVAATIMLGFGLWWLGRAGRDRARFGARIVLNDVLDGGKILMHQIFYPPARYWRRVLLSSIMAATLAACNEQTDTAEPTPRPVRTVTLEKSEAGVPVVLTGRIEALDEASLGFRLSGRMIERAVNTGDRVEAGQLLGRLEALNELNALTAAKANVAVAQAKVTQVRNHFERQQTLLAQGWTTRANFDQAERELRTAEAQLDAAEAQLKAAHDQVDFTELKADAEGVVTAVGAEPGEVVQAGQMIVRLARHGGRDAIFDVPAQVLRTAPTDSEVKVHLADDSSVTATGRVREVSPQADPVMRTFQVKVGLTDPPEAMRLGATVIGTLQTDTVPMIEIPSSALTEFNGQPAVWIVDPKALTVEIRNVDVQRFDPATVTVSQGLNIGDVVVTAGVQALRPGQKVRLVGLDS